MFSSAMTVSAFRKPVVEFIVKTYEKFSSFFVDQNSVIETNNQLVKAIEIEMNPQYLPDGFSVTENYDDVYSHITKWKNKEKEYIEFLQSGYSIIMNEDTENINIKTKSIEDMILYYYTQYSYHGTFL